MVARLALAVVPVLALMACGGPSGLRPSTAPMQRPTQCLALALGAWNDPADPNVRDHLWTPLPRRIALIDTVSDAPGWMIGRAWVARSSRDSLSVRWRQPSPDSIEVRIEYQGPWWILMSLHRLGRGYDGIGVGITHELYEPRPWMKAAASPVSCRASA